MGPMGPIGADGADGADGAVGADEADEADAPVYEGLLFLDAGFNLGVGIVSMWWPVEYRF